jgi:chaperone required for assembly of F1-ATPase
MTMAGAYTVTPQDSAFAVCTQGKALLTPAKTPLRLPTKALADAICAEWQAQGKYSISAMPLTSLAYTALDQIAGKEALIVEALLVYIDTDTLSYRATSSEKLAAAQNAQWNPVLAWAGKTFGAIWAVTTGVMPLEQSPELHKAIQKRLQSLDAMRLSVCCVLASGYSSLVLALAVLENHLDAGGAFTLSRLEEESQAERWGRDAEADARAKRLQAEIVAAGRFLGLLETP